MQHIVVGDKVTVNVKILSLKEIEEVTSSRSGKTLKKQDVVALKHVDLYCGRSYLIQFK